MAGERQLSSKTFDVVIKANFFSLPSGGIRAVRDYFPTLELPSILMRYDKISSRKLFFKLLSCLFLRCRENNGSIVYVW